MLDWLIVGGGIHGTYLANFLTTTLGYRFDQVAVIDPHPEPCHLWKKVTGNTGMNFLRSPEGHHIGLHPESLATYAASPSVRPWASTLGIMRRPSLKLFNSHIDRQVRQFGLTRMFRRGRVISIREIKEGLSVKTDTNLSFEARHVVLCVGQSENPSIPDWVSTPQKFGADIQHVLDEKFELKSYGSGDHVAIVGGGITAAQLAIFLAQKYVPVDLVCRQPIPMNDLDFDPCWTKPECLDSFEALVDPDERRAIVTESRFKGTAPSDIHERLEEFIKSGRIKLVLGDVKKLERGGPKDLYLTLQNGKRIECNRIILATGVEAGRPGGSWLDHVAINMKLPVHGKGFPLTDALLRWGHPRLFVTGALAELELGPAARNIIGAKLAAERILRWHQL